MSAHAELSPSSSSRWLACPGSPRLIRETGPYPDESSEYADEGTFAHSIAERAIRHAMEGGTSAAGELRRLHNTVSDCIRFQATAEMLEHLEDYVGRADDALSAGHDVFVEKRVHAIQGVVYGTADLTIYTGRSLTVDDLKYGAGIPVRAEGNTQARCYALGAYFWLGHVLHPHTPVTIRVTQPRNDRGGGEETLTVAELLNWHSDVLLPGVEATRDPAAPLVPGEHCRFCPAREKCPARHEKALEVGRAVFTDTLEKRPAAPSVGDLTPEQLGKILDGAPMLEEWLKSVRMRARELADRGRNVPGYKLVQTLANRRWTDEGAAFKMLNETLPEGVSPYAAPVLISPSKAEKAIKGKAGKDAVAPHTERTVTGTALVPLSDSRPAFVPGPVFSKTLPDS